jgi:hypothetical protein
MPASDIGLRVTSLKYSIEIRVSTRSLMLLTLAFSNGDIFMEIMLPRLGWGTCVLESDGKDECISQCLEEEGAEGSGEVVEDGLVLLFDDEEAEVVGQTED